MHWTLRWRGWQPRTVVFLNYSLLAVKVEILEALNQKICVYKKITRTKQNTFHIESYKSFEVKDLKGHYFYWFWKLMMKQNMNKIYYECSISSGRREQELNQVMGENSWN